MTRNYNLWAMLGLIGVNALLLGCDPPPVVAGGRQTCATKDGRVRCWGFGQYGVLGYANTANVGDNEHPAAAGDVVVGAAVDQLALGYYHTCALLTTGAVRCWGRNSSGQLGYGHKNDIGDNETPASALNVPLGGTAVQISAGIYHTCALLSTGAVRCWGEASYGQLGYGNMNDIGDDETPASAGSVNVGGAVEKIAAGGFHTCALLTGGSVRCWGLGALGALGYGNTNMIGDNELPFTAGNVNVGGAVKSITSGEGHTCVILEGSNQVRCWGYGVDGRLGYSNTNTIGDNESPASAGNVSIGVQAQMISAGSSHTCALGTDQLVRCWGSALFGVLGYGNANSIGDNETPASAGPVSLGGSVLSISVGYEHSCALLAGGDNVRCWGNGFGGKLGYATTQHVGDNELPSSLPLVVIE